MKYDIVYSVDNGNGLGFSDIETLIGDLKDCMEMIRALRAKYGDAIRIKAVYENGEDLEKILSSSFATN